MGRPVVYWELTAGDPEALSGFYEKVFGWNVKYLPEMDYRHVETGSERGISGGIADSARDARGPGITLFYVEVDELATYRDKVVAAGGKIRLEELQVPGMGAYALVTDPEGRLLGLWRPDAPQGR